MEESLEFDWDSSNLRHLARHHISREEFEQAMINDPIYQEFRDDSGEPRWEAIGMTKQLRLLYLVFTIRGECIRPVTAWDASREMRAYFFREKAREANLWPKGRN